MNGCCSVPGGAGAVAALLAVLSLAGCGVETEPTRPSVVLVVIDTLRADRVTARRNDVPVMPSLERLARDSLYSPTMISACSWTKPAMASMLTSLHVDTHQVFYGSAAATPESLHRLMPGSLELMAECLKRHGYECVCIQTNPHLTSETGFSEGFDHYAYLPSGTADQVTAEALRQLEVLTEPFFLYLHYIDPHWPYWPPAGYRERFADITHMKDEEVALLRKGAFNAYIADRAKHDAGWRQEREYEPFSESTKELARALYDGEARFVDDELAKVLAGLGAAFPTALVVVTSDHGEELWEHGRVGHGSTLYDEAVRVPLMFRAPDIEPRRLDTAARSLDVLPTVAAYLGLPPEPSWQGRNLLVSSAPGTPAAFSHTRACSPLGNVHWESVIKGNRKLLVSLKKERMELYDLDRDPEEGQDIFDAQPEVAQELAGLLAAHRERCAQHREKLGIDEEAPPEGPAPELSEEAKQELRALGYL